MPSSYVASIHVTHTNEKAGARHGDPPIKAKESFRVTVAAPSLAKMKEKISAHVDLIDGNDLIGED